MRLIDRLAARLGYVPKPPSPEEVIADRLTRYYAMRDRERTETTVITPPQVLVSADFKRGIPCS